MNWDGQTPIYVVNLDRRQDRIDHIGGQLDNIGLKWQRISAVDANDPEAAIDPRIRRENHVIPMKRGSQAYCTTLLALLAKVADDDAPAAILLQDDIDISPDIAKYARSLDWLPDDIGLVQFEKWGSRPSSKLMGPEVGQTPCEGRGMRKLYSRTGGAACFLIRREVAALISDSQDEIKAPADHLLFSPNVSPFFYKMGVAMVTPCLARQSAGLPSDLRKWRRRMTMGEEFRRSLTEINRVPRQIGNMLWNGARVHKVTFK